MKNNQKQNNLQKQSNLLTNLINEDYQSYYINSGVSLSYLEERSFIDDAIENLTGKAKEGAARVGNKALDTIRSGAKRLTQDGRRQLAATKQFEKNVKEQGKISKQIFDLEDKNPSEDDFDINEKIANLQDKLNKIGQEQDRLTPFVLDDIKFFTANDSVKKVLNYAGKKESGIEKYTVLSQAYGQYVQRYGEDNPKAKIMKQKRDVLGSKLVDKGAFQEYTTK
tara:strand:+ start:24661 stop:25332 length:672 start_codon:yes stop_codon:yes gene_type:complete